MPVTRLLQHKEPKMPHEEASRKRVEQLLREVIAPELELDGGEIEVVAVADGIASVRMAGVCASCPASLPVVIQSMEQELRKYLPEIEVIEAVP